MNKAILYAAAVTLVSCAIGGCAHVGVNTADPLGSMSQVPASSSSPYVALDPSLSMLEDTGKGEGPLRQRQIEAPGGVPSEFKGRILHLPDCVRIALKSNPQTQSTWQAVRSAGAHVGEEKSAYLPSADFSATVARQKQVTSQNLQSDQPAEASEDSDVAFKLSYVLFDGGQRSARVSGAQADLQALGFQHNAALQEVALRVEQAYFTLLATRWSQQVAEETVGKAEYHVRLSQARFDNGLVARSDVLKAETEKADANLSLVSARNSVRIAHGTLASAMGLRVSTSAEVADITESSYPREAEEMERLLDEATRNRPELLAAVAKVKSREAAIQEAKSQYWPKLTANAGYGWVDDSYFPNKDQWSVGLMVSFPLFTGFKRGYQVERAGSDAERVRADYINQLRGVELDVWTAYSRLIEAGESIEAARSFVASAEESARLAEGEYKAGTGNIIALIDAQTALTSARNRLVQSRFVWHTSRAQFEKAVGRSLAANILVSRSVGEWANGKNR